ncbi:MAG: lipid-A-disaccharide synthase [Planctomycetaceae bacterium]
MHLFFSVGEPSGDQHAAHLIHELKRRRPDLRCTGYGGPLMRQAGCELDYRLTDLAVMGFVRVLPLLWRFIQLVRQADRKLKTQRPDAVILVDFPGFNWWIARKAKAAGIPVFYYLPPQIWAWASWRVKRMQRDVDHVLCALPFEPPWFQKFGVHAEHVGHPFFDEIADHQLDAEFLSQQRHVDQLRMGLLPGSRNQEVRRNLPILTEIVRRVAQQHAQTRFLVACYKQEHLEFCESYLAQHAPTLDISCVVGKTPEVIELADCCLMVSGSVSLELLARATPAIVIYRCNRLFYWIARHWLARTLVEINSITLPNMLSQSKLIPEYVVAGNPRPAIQEVAHTLNAWLGDPEQLGAVRDKMQAVRDEFVHTGATRRTADAILNRASSTQARRAA